MPTGQRFFIDATRPDDSGAGTSEAAAWKTGDKATTLADATPFHFGAGCEILFKAGQTHTIKKLRLIKQGGSAAPVKIGRYGEGPDPILATGGTNDEALFPGVIALDSCYRFEISHLVLDANWQTAGPGTGVAGVIVRHIADSSIVHAVVCRNVVARKAGQDGFVFHAFAAAAAPTPSMLVNCEGDRCMDNGWGLYGPSVGFTVWNGWWHGNGNLGLSVPDYGPLGGDGGSSHDTAVGVLDAFNRYENNRDGSHHINTGVPSATLLGNYYRGNSQAALKLMDYGPAANSYPQLWTVLGCLFVIDAAATGNGGVIFGRDGEDVPPATGVDAGTGGVFSGLFAHNTIVNASAIPSLFMSWKDHAANDTAAFQLANNLFVRDGAGPHVEIKRRGRPINFTASRNGFSSDASGQFVLDGANKTLAEMKTAGIFAATSAAAAPQMTGDPDDDPANAVLGAASPFRGVADNLDAVAAALGVSVRELFRGLFPSGRARNLGCFDFASSPSGLLLPRGPVPAFPAYAF